MTTQLWVTFHVVMETNATLRVRAALCKRRLSVRHPLKIGCAISNLINIFDMNKLEDRVSLRLSALHYQPYSKQPYYSLALRLTSALYAPGQTTSKTH